VNASVSAFPSLPGNSNACFDVDEDGDVDLIQPTGIWLNDGSAAFTWYATNIPLGSFMLEVLPADYDGDGDIDLPGLSNLLRHVEAPQPAVRGATYSVNLHSRPNVCSLAPLFYATGRGTTPLGPFGTLQLDSASVMIVGLQLPPSMTPTSYSWLMPTSALLAGVELHFQAIVEDPLNGFVASSTFYDVLN